MRGAGQALPRRQRLGRQRQRECACATLVASFSFSSHYAWRLEGTGNALLWVTSLCRDVFLHSLSQSFVSLPSRVVGVQPLYLLTPVLALLVRREISWRVSRGCRLSLQSHATLRVCKSACRGRSNSASSNQSNLIKSNERCNLSSAWRPPLIPAPSTMARQLSSCARSSWSCAQRRTPVAAAPSTLPATRTSTAGSSRCR